jgi:Methylated DNA-protein cysteine methyltransferase
MLFARRSSHAAHKNPAHPDAVIALPFGRMGLFCTDDVVLHLEYLPPETPLTPPSTPLCRAVAAQLSAYGDDPAYRFDLPLAAAGTAFQCRVWALLQQIPPGQKRTYGDAALQVAQRRSGRGAGLRRQPVRPRCAVSPHRRARRAGRVCPFHRARRYLLASNAGCCSMKPARDRLVRMPEAPLYLEWPPAPEACAATIDRFCDALWLEDGLSPNTLAAYRRDLTLMARWLAFFAAPALDRGDAARCAGVYRGPICAEQSHLVQPATGGVAPLLPLGLA